MGGDFQGDGDTFEGSGVVMNSRFAVRKAQHCIVIGALQEGAGHGGAAGGQARGEDSDRKRSEGSVVKATTWGWGGGRLGGWFHVKVGAG